MNILVLHTEFDSIAGWIGVQLLDDLYDRRRSHGSAIGPNGSPRVVLRFTSRAVPWPGRDRADAGDPRWPPWETLDQNIIAQPIRSARSSNEVGLGNHERLGA